VSIRLSQFIKSLTEDAIYSFYLMSRVAEIVYASISQLRHNVLPPGSQIKVNDSHVARLRAPMRALFGSSLKGRLNGLWIKFHC
jgi:hypothetical protein